jgi:hypothetical protein
MKKIMKSPKFKFKIDQYRKNRGDYSRIIDVHCRKCKTLIMKYQKDGPGVLRRLYFDRILTPKELTELEKKTLSKIKDLKCPKCKILLGTPYIFPQENRKCFRMYQDAVTKKVTKLSSLVINPKLL